MNALSTNVQDILREDLVQLQGNAFEMPAASRYTPRPGLTTCARGGRAQCTEVRVCTIACIWVRHAVELALHRTWVTLGTARLRLVTHLLPSRACPSATRHAWALSLSEYCGFTAAQLAGTLQSLGQSKEECWLPNQNPSW